MVAIEIFIQRAHCMETNKGFSERGEEGYQFTDHSEMNPRQELAIAGNMIEIDTSADNTSVLILSSCPRRPIHRTSPGIRGDDW